MAATTKTWSDGNPPKCNADDLNGFKKENNNLILGSGQVISTADNQQTHKAVSVYAHGGNFYSDTGIANAYALNPIGAKIAPPAYFDGMAVVFAPGNANTGASTVNVSSLGAKNIYLNGAALTGGEIPAGAVTVLRYSLSNDRFDVEAVHEQFGNSVRLLGSSPVLALKDKDSSGASQTGKVSFEDSAGSEVGILGYDSAVSTKLKLENKHVGGDLDLVTSGGNVLINGAAVVPGRGAAAYFSTGQPIPNNVWTPVSFTSEVYDSDSIHDNIINNSRFTVPAGVTGVEFRAYVRWDNNATGQRQLDLYKNGVVLPNPAVLPSGQAVAVPLSQFLISYTIPVTGGDFLELFAFQNSGVSRTLSGNFNYAEMRIVT